LAKPLTVAACLKYRPGSKRREIPDGGAKGLYLIVQVSGVKSWALRYRRPNGKNAKLTLGPVDLTGSESDHQPKLGTPLTLVGARMLAAEQLRERARGIDVAARHVAEKRHQREAAANAGVNTFAALARAYIDEHCRRHTRRWRESGFLLGIEFAADGDPIMRKNGLASRWKERELRSITADELHDIVIEAQRIGVPGRQPRHPGPSDNRARSMAVVLGAMFSWCKKRRHIAVDPALDLFKPAQSKARQRVLNVRLDVRKGDEVRWLWSATDTLGQPVAALIKLLLITGCRLNEIAGLIVDEVSDDCVTLRIPGSRTKNHKPFEVYLPSLGRELLASVPRFTGCKYVFSMNGKSPINSWSKIKHRLDQAMLRIARAERGDDYQIEPWRIHDLRRSAATGMAGIGIAPHVIESALNHVSGHKAGVAGIYNQEQYSEEKRIAWLRWAEHIAAVINGAAATNVVPFAAGA
jgi:integrase